MIVDSPAALDRLVFTPGDGLIPVAAQHADTGELLMVAWADRTALERTLADGEAWFWSRRRRRHWRKGETSGQTLRVVSLHADCDGDTILARVLPTGPACHTGAANCFDAAPTLVGLDRVIAARVEADPGTSYTARLLADRNRRLKKIGEEGAELVAACVDGDPGPVAEEAADLLYHLLVAARGAGVGLSAILAALARRRTPA